MQNGRAARSWLFVLWGVLALGVGAVQRTSPGGHLIRAALAGDEPVPTAATFEAELSVIKRDCRRGKCKRGLSALRTLFLTHPERPYVTARKTELVDLVRRLAFGAKFPPPDPDDITSGAIRSYNARTGRLHARYAPDQMGDWKSEHGFRMFPAELAGRTTITIKGTRYPQLAEDSFVFVFGNQDDPKTGKTQLWEFYFGSPTRHTKTHKHWLPPRMIHHDGDTKRTSSMHKEMPLYRGSNFKLEIKITPTRITAKVDRRLVGEARKPRELWGMFGFRGKDFTEIRIDGTVEPAWIQGKLDAIAEGHRVAFEADFDPADHLPVWLLQAKDTRTGGTRAALPAHPEGLSAVQREHFDLVLRASARAGGPVPTGYAQTLMDLRLPKGAAHYLVARAHLVRHELLEARVSITRCRAFTRAFARAALLEGMILALEGRNAEADALMQPVLERHTPDLALYGGLSIALMRQGRPAAARILLALAAKHGVASPQLEVLDQALLKALGGPDWRRVYEAKTKTYHVLTDIDKRTAREAATVLEAMHQTYRSTLQKIPRDESRLFKVYLFSGQAGFLGYLGDLRMFWGAGGKRAAGVYSSLLKQLLIWNLPNREAMLKTVRHEGFHQFFDRYLPHAPVWFNEGLAEYYEVSDRVAGKVRTGRVSYDNVRLLRKDGLMPLSTLFALEGKAFYAAAPKSYAMSWLVVHLLRKGGARERAYFGRFIEALEAGPAPAAMQSVFTASDLKALDQAAARYLASLPNAR